MNTGRPTIRKQTVATIERIRRISPLGWHQDSTIRMDFIQWNYQMMTCCTVEMVQPTCTLEMQLAKLDYPNSNASSLAYKHRSSVSPRLDALLVFASYWTRLFTNRSLQSLQTFLRKSFPFFLRQSQTQCDWPCYRN